MGGKHYNKPPWFLMVDTAWGTTLYIPDIHIYHDGHPETWKKKQSEFYTSKLRLLAPHRVVLGAKCSSRASDKKLHMHSLAGWEPTTSQPGHRDFR